MKPLTYTEALEWARKQGIVLPDEYYGLLFGRARAAAFSVAGVSALDQLQAIHDSLLDVMEKGGTFAKWRKDALDGKIPLDFPDHRLETIFRTNIQGWYSAGRCRSDKANKRFRPYLMYSAINDSRTRPAHAEMDNTILPVDHPWWDDHRPPNGFNCRCSTISLSEEEAEEFGGVTVIAPDAMPDKGWDYSPCKHGPEEGIQRATEARAGRCGQQYQAGIPVELALREPWWCQHEVLRQRMLAYLDQLGGWDDLEKLAIAALGKKAWNKHVEAARAPSLDAGIELPLGVVLRAYTDRHLDTWPLANELARLMNHVNDPIRHTFTDLERSGLLVYLLDEALAGLRRSPGVYHRGVDTKSGWPRKAAFVSAHTHVGNITAWDGFSSVMNGAPYGYNMRFVIEATDVVDIQPFSVGNEAELVIPRSACFKVLRYYVKRDIAYVHVKQLEDCNNVKRRKHFSNE